MPSSPPLNALTPPANVSSPGSLWPPKSQDHRNIQSASRLLETGRYIEAIEFCSDLLKKNPNNARAYAGRAEAYRRMGKLDEAIPDFRFAIGLGIYPAPEVLQLALGLIFWKQGRPTEALVCFYEIIAGDLYNPLAWALIVNMRALLGEVEASEDCFKHALSCL